MTTTIFLSKKENLFFVDGYCRKNTQNKNYISLDLCHIILQFFKNTLNIDFIIIFEKFEDDYVNELLCYDVKLKTKIIKDNELWKWNMDTSYCIHETNNDCLIYRVGGQDNHNIPNIEYSMINDEHNELPLTQTKRWWNSTIFNVNYGLITIGGYNGNDGSLSSVEILNDKKEWKYLSPMNNKRRQCSSIPIENKLFVFGGWDNINLNLSEMLDLSDNNNANNANNKNLKWMNLKNMKYAKYSIGIKYFENKKQIILIGGYGNYAMNDEISRSFSMFEINKNEFIEYPNTSRQHSWKPGIVIQNNNVIYVIKNHGMKNNRVEYSFGVIECYDIRDKRWFEIDELNKIFSAMNEESNNNKKERWFQCVLNTK